MKHRAFLFMVAAGSLLSTPSLAAPVFMLQFGSFETREEAEKRLSELKSTHSGVLSSMGSGIREVTLPPDNLTVYRTQAGPLNTRADAQSVCSQLASNGDECYVVETAMVPPMSSPTTQVAQAPASSAASSSSAVLPTPAAVATNAAPATRAAAPAAPTTVAANTASSVPARDPENIAAMSRVSTVPAPVSASAVGDSTAPVAAAASEATPAPAPVASPSLQQAMDEAAAEQQAALNAAPAPADAKPEGSFWSRLNPFSSDEPSAPPVVSVPSSPTPPAQPAAVATQEPVVVPMPEQPMIAQKAPEPAAPAAAPSASLTTPVVVPETTNAPAPIVMASTTDAVTLPPPPAPLVGKGAINGGTPVTATASATPTGPAPVIVPQSTGNVPPPLVVPEPAASTPAPFATASADNVRVGEAQRVPLSQQPTPMNVPMGTLTPMPAPSAASLSPSATLGQKTLWAQIGQFNDAQSALAFWQQYRTAHPDFPVVRVRVTNNYQSLMRGNPKTSLRVGPFAREGALKNLCATLPETEPALRCGTVVDMGIQTRSPGARGGFLPGSRYRR